LAYDISSALFSTVAFSFVLQADLDIDC